VPIFEKRSVVDVPAADLFAWHTRPGAFERLVPPWEHIRVLARHGGIADGGRVTMIVKRGPLTIRWEAVHRGLVEGEQFQDVQVKTINNVFVTLPVTVQYRVDEIGRAHV